MQAPGGIKFSLIYPKKGRHSLQITVSNTRETLYNLIIAANATWFTDFETKFGESAVPKVINIQNLHGNNRLLIGGNSIIPDGSGGGNSYGQYEGESFGIGDTEIFKGIYLVGSENNTIVNIDVMI